MLRSVDLESASDATLIEMAAAGGRRAAGELLGRRMPMLSSMARRITLPSIDAEDLLADAVACLLDKWAHGIGPDDCVDTYLIRSMRNQIIDEIRSPRSKTTTVEVLPDVVEQEPAEFHQIELHQEFSLVQRALERLPENQRRVLQATVVENLSPAELAIELGRPAGAVYALRQRAKKRLQRALLQTILEENDGESCCGDCRKYARKLPEVITVDFIDDQDSPAAAHIRDCECCNTSWQQYLHLAGLTQSSHTSDPARL
jgi:RNA polymerase sigma-70 factor (ECF subfamily)